MNTKSIIAALSLTFALLFAGSAHAQYSMDSVVGVYQINTDIDCDGSAEIHSYMALRPAGVGTLDSERSPIVANSGNSWFYHTPTNSFSIVFHGNTMIEGRGLVRVDAAYQGEVTMGRPAAWGSTTLVPYMLRGRSTAGMMSIDGVSHRICWQGVRYR